MLAVPYWNSANMSYLRSPANQQGYLWHNKSTTVITFYSRKL